MVFDRFVIKAVGWYCCWRLTNFPFTAPHVCQQRCLHGRQRSKEKRCSGVVHKQTLPVPSSPCINIRPLPCSPWISDVITPPICCRLHKLVDRMIIRVCSFQQKFLRQSLSHNLGIYNTVIWPGDKLLEGVIYGNCLDALVQATV
jgi:hypothetical protein